MKINVNKPIVLVSMLTNFHKQKHVNFIFHKINICVVRNRGGGWGGGEKNSPRGTFISIFLTIPARSESVIKWGILRVYYVQSTQFGLKFHMIITEWNCEIGSTALEAFCLNYELDFYFWTQSPPPPHPQPSSACGLAHRSPQSAHPSHRLNSACNLACSPPFQYQRLFS